MITRTIAGTVLLLTASMAGAAAAGPCDSVTSNDWTWFIGGKVNFAPSGHTRFTGSGAIPAASGKWTCSADGTIRITWENGFVDTLRMIGPKGPQPIGPQGRPPPKGAG